MKQYKCLEVMSNSMYYKIIVNA